MANLNDAIKDELEDAWLSEVNRLAFGLGVDDQGSAQTVQRIAWRDGSQTYAAPAAIVHASSVVPAYLQGPLYDVTVSLVAVTYAEDDKDRTDLTAIHNQLQHLAVKMAMATLNALMTGVTVHAIESLDVIESDDGNMQSLSVEMTCSVYSILAGPTTTTTTTTTA